MSFPCYLEYLLLNSTCSIPFCFFAVAFTSKRRQLSLAGVHLKEEELYLILSPKHFRNILQCLSCVSYFTFFFQDEVVRKSSYYQNVSSAMSNFEFLLIGHTKTSKRAVTQEKKCAGVVVQWLKLHVQQWRPVQCWFHCWLLHFQSSLLLILPGKQWDIRAGLLCPRERFRCSS